MQPKGMSRVEMQTVMGTLFTKNGLRKTGNHTYPSSPRLSVRHVLKPGTPEHPGTPELLVYRTKFDGVVLFSYYRPCKI